MTATTTVAMFADRLLPRGFDRAVKAFLETGVVPEGYVAEIGHATGEDTFHAGEHAGVGKLLKEAEPAYGWEEWRVRLEDYTLRPVDWPT